MKLIPRKNGTEEENNNISKEKNAICNGGVYPSVFKMKACVD